MVLMGMEVEFLIMDSYSLKDKRSVVKSIIDRMHNRYNVSAAEVDENEVLNKGVIGIGIVTNNRRHAQKVLQQVLKEIEDLYPVEIIHTEWMEY
ncbi:DUF503 domain-containing protein [Atopococcus tabaci]|uniref:DUF503 domain-containing protein n=1 Tax=Atopococcus tabaci TaxID=269774 RepID=UPI00041E914F|nr:DUF503 domain-containing protein [Atopococcus tabaci]